MYFHVYKHYRETLIPSLLRFCSSSDEQPSRLFFRNTGRGEGGSNVFSGQQPFLENRVLVYEFLSALGQGFSRFPFGRAGGGSGHQYFKHLSDFNGH